MNGGRSCFSNGYIMFISPILVLFTAVFWVGSVECAQRGCDRSRSRLVRKVVYEKLMAAFTSLNTELSEECMFSPARDRYRTQETHKSVEEGIKWYCHFCGKSFINEYYLDLHFDNRHTDQLEEENSLCLADTCEVFRCDVVGRKIVPDYWDIALCLEDDMASLHRKCEAMVKSCVPSGLTANETQVLYDVTMQELCSYLTCSKYWEVPFDTGPAEGLMGLYIIMTVLVTLGVTIYFLIFYAYFFTDTFSDSISYDPTPKTKTRIKPYQPDLRHRPRTMSSSNPD